ncbi:MAG: organic solvent transporter substrate-binding protein [Frankiales bacterium]|nr:organic solvent transporter substrate-binding protein [Frankiales bacterium]
MKQALRRVLPAGPRPAPVVGVAVVALVALTAGLASQGQRDDDALDITAVFTDASALLPGNEVKIGGVTAGVVESIDLIEGKAQLSFSIAPEFLPLHRDATAFIKPVSLLGERYVDLDPGTHSAPLLEDGGVLPAEQTGRLADLDEVLDVVDAPTGEALAATLTTLGVGIGGNGAPAAKALDRLPAAMKDTERLIAVLERQNATLSELVDAATPVARSLGTERGARLDGLVEGASRVLAATTAEQRALEQSLQALPATLVEAHARLASLADTAEQATPLLKDIRPVTTDLEDISGELDRLSRAADPALTRLTPVLERAQALITQARPVAADLAAAAPAARSVTASGRPVALALIGDETKLANLLEFIRNWALTTNGKDGLSHYFRAHAIVSEETLMGPIPVDTPLKDVTKDLPAIGVPTAVPLVTGLPGLGDVVRRLPALPLLDPDSATGLTVHQERDLLGILLGGRR